MPKTLKRILTLTLLSFLMVGGCLWAKAAPSTDYAYKELSKKEKSLYRKLDEAVEKLTVEIKDVALEEESVERVFLAFLSDHPGVFWVGNSYSYTIRQDTDATVQDLRLSYTHTENLAAERKELQKILSDFHSVIKKEKDDWAKLYYIYSFLASKVRYDRVYSDQTLWSVFNDGIGVCAGFAKAFQCLALQEKIPCIVVTGNKLDKDGKKSSEGHMWCMAKISGKWYHFDPTWALSENLDTVDYSYFCRSEEKILLTHTLDNAFPVPKAKDDSLSYARKKGRCFESYKEKKIKEAVSEALKNHENTITLEFSSTRDAEKAKTFLVDKSGLAPLFPKGSGTIHYQYSLNQQNHTLRLVFQ